jgi:hypothetical protein
MTRRLHIFSPLTLGSRLEELYLTVIPEIIETVRLCFDTKIGRLDLKRLFRTSSVRCPDLNGGVNICRICSCPCLTHLKVSSHLTLFVSIITIHKFDI